MFLGSTPSDKLRRGESPRLEHKPRHARETQHHNSIRKERNDSRASTEALRPRALHTGQWAPQGHSREQKERAEREPGSTVPGIIAGDLDHPGTAAVTSRAGLLPLSYPSPLGPRPSGACRLADVGKQLVLPTGARNPYRESLELATTDLSLSLIVEVTEYKYSLFVSSSRASKRCSVSPTDFVEVRPL